MNIPTSTTTTWMPQQVTTVMLGVGCRCYTVWNGIFPPPPCPVHSRPVGAQCVHPCPCGCGPDYSHTPPAWFQITC